MSNGSFSFGFDTKPKDIINEFLEPPFSVLDGRTGRWLDRKRWWVARGIRSEEGRDVLTYKLMPNGVNTSSPDYKPQTSTFDAALCEIMYRWYSAPGESVLDPFAGGSVRGLVCGSLGMNYTGVELREEQVSANNRQLPEFSAPEGFVPPTWICGDSAVEVEKLSGPFDMVFSCPPYGDLEVYSDDPRDISNMTYDGFISQYEKIIADSAKLLKAGGFAVFVVGDFRGPSGAMRGFVADTERAFEKAGCPLWNEHVYLTPAGSGPLRAMRFNVSKKAVKTHQNVLVFKKI